MAVYTTIDDPGLYFNTVLYSGNSSTQAITGVGFQPDAVWAKTKSTTYNHQLCDSVRGVHEMIRPNTSDAEGTYTDALTSFDSDGFTTGSEANWNETGQTYVAWNWKAGTTAVPSGGTITPTACSFSATAGFGAYAHAGNSTAGATIAHGLGAVPAMMISKRLNHTGNWATYQQKNTAAPATEWMAINLTNATADDSSVWNDTAPDATVFTIGDDGTVNGAYNYIKYIWTEIKGYSKFGGYIGNGNVDGTFVYTGFRPAFVMCKYTGVENWAIVDNKRLGYNVANYQLYANATNANVSNVRMDILSNGFKARTTNAEWNGSGNEYIYMAFAEAPFVNSEGVPVNAR